MENRVEWDSEMYTSSYKCWLLGCLSNESEGRDKSFEGAKAVW